MAAFFRDLSKFGVGAAVERLEYDPNRSAFIALSSTTTASSPTFWRPNVCGPAIG
jgi:ribosomal protein L2